MSRPLLITDCDEVLLHMVTHFADWLGETEDIHFDIDNGGFEGALTYRKNGQTVETDAIWPLLGGFFDTEMPRQTAIPGALDAIREIGKIADIVILTNLTHERNDDRREQLLAHGIDYPVVTNQGEKGPPLKKIIDDYQPSVALFIDDLPQHHKSAASHAPDCWRLHMIGEEKLAPQVACAHKAKHAHNRIDTWKDALPWIMDRLQAGQPAPRIEREMETNTHDG